MSSPAARRTPAPPPPTAEDLRADAAERAKRSFLRMASHELRTPLNAIIGFSEILSGELYGPLGRPEYKEYADIIHTAGGRLLRLVNQVLEVARLEGGAVDIDPRAEPLDAVFDDAADAVEDELEARGLTLVRRLPERAPIALADARAIRTAVVNLLQNAIAFAPEGGEVRLSASVQGPLVVIEVADDGEGLDPAQIERLMKPFEQGDNALVRRHEGAGLGWPLVRLLCEAMGGGFAVRTAPGEGLAAAITLRRAG